MGRPAGVQRLMKTAMPAKYAERLRRTPEDHYTPEETSSEYQTQE